MKHATSETIIKIEPLLNRIRNFSELKEKKPGIYYYKSKAFLHFHEDSDLIFADIKLHPPDFERLPVTTNGQQEELIRLIRERVK